MKVRIIRCSHEDWWYKDRIGEVFELIKEENDEHYLIDKNGIDKAFVEQKDVALIEEATSCRYAKALCNECSTQCEKQSREEILAIITAYRTIQAQTEQLIAFYERKLAKLDNV